MRCSMRTVLVVVSALLAPTACGGGGPPTCSDATIMNSCGTPANGSCHDTHGNACILCSGSHVTNGCIYDPSAPLDGGTAVCVAQCTECGSECQPQY